MEKYILRKYVVDLAEYIHILHSGRLCDGFLSTFNSLVYIIPHNHPLLLNDDVHSRDSISTSFFDTVVCTHIGRTASLLLRDVLSDKQ